MQCDLLSSPLYQTLTSQLESRPSAVFNAANKCKLLLHCTCMCELDLLTVTCHAVGRAPNSKGANEGHIRKAVMCCAAVCS